MQFLYDFWNHLFEVNIFEYYSKNIRYGLFSGFLSLTGFLFSAYTFIVLLLKKEIYDQEWYFDRNLGPRMRKEVTNHYTPLANLSKSLMWTIFLCALASISQFSLGLIEFNIFAYVCLLLALIGVVRLARSLWLISTSIKKWLDDCEKEKEVEYKQKIGEINESENPGLE